MTQADSLLSFAIWKVLTFDLRKPPPPPTSLQTDHNTRTRRNQGVLTNLPCYVLNVSCIVYVRKFISPIPMLIFSFPMLIFSNVNISFSGERFIFKGSCASDFLSAPTSDDLLGGCTLHIIMFKTQCTHILWIMLKKS